MISFNLLSTFPFFRKLYPWTRKIFILGIGLMYIPCFFVIMNYVIGMTPLVFLSIARFWSSLFSEKLLFFCDSLNSIFWYLRWFSTRKLEKELPGGRTHFVESCGLPISTYFSAVKLLWLMENVDAVKAAIKKKGIWSPLDLTILNTIRWHDMNTNTNLTRHEKITKTRHGQKNEHDTETWI